MRFEDLYLCKPAPIDRFLHDLGEEYHRRAEAYDQLVCSGRTEDGVAMPIGNREYVMINRNAIALRQELIERGRNAGYSPDEIRRAITRAAK